MLCNHPHRFHKSFLVYGNLYVTFLIVIVFVFLSNHIPNNAIVEFQDLFVTSFYDDDRTDNGELVNLLS